MQRIIRTPDGRTLSLEEGGDPAGRPVLVHNGTPNSRHLYGPHLRDAMDRGLRLIGYARPGYETSSPRPGRSVADCADDVRAICAELGINRLGMWGISFGGTHALACAALMPDLVSAVATLASPAPFGADGLDFFAGMGQGNVDDTRQYLADKTAARAQADEDWKEYLATPEEDRVKGMASLLTPVDAAVMSGDLGKFMAASAQEGIALSVQGWWDDYCCVDRWGFDVGDIGIPVLLLHGKHDKFVPFGHGEWLAAHIPGVEARILDDDGHLSLYERRIPEVHAWLSERL